MYENIYIYIYIYICVCVCVYVCVCVCVCVCKIKDYIEIKACCGLYKSILLLRIMSLRNRACTCTLKDNALYSAIKYARDG